MFKSFKGYRLIGKSFSVVRPRQCPQETLQTNVWKTGKKNPLLAYNKSTYH